MFLKLSKPETLEIYYITLYLYFLVDINFILKTEIQYIEVFFDHFQVYSSIFQFFQYEYGATLGNPTFAEMK